jgi:hypothetical protein
MSLLTLAAMVWSVIGMPVPKRTIRLTIAGTTPHQTGTPVVLDLPGDAKKPLPVVKVDEPTGTAGETVDARIAPPDPGPTIEAVIPPKPEAVSEAAPASDPPLAQPPSPPQNIRLVAPESGNSAPPAPVRLRFVQP